MCCGCWAVDVQLLLLSKLWMAVVLGVVCVQFVFKLGPLNRMQCNWVCWHSCPVAWSLGESMCTLSANVAVYPSYVYIGFGIPLLMVAWLLHWNSHAEPPSPFMLRPSHSLVHVFCGRYLRTHIHTPHPPGHHTRSLGCCLLRRPASLPATHTCVGRWSCSTCSCFFTESLLVL